MSHVHYGDCLDVMWTFPSGSVDLIFTSPPYANARAKTYGGIDPDDYVEWFLPRAEEMKRLLKPTGSLVINIKEKVVDGQRHTYVLDLIKALKDDAGLFWCEEYIWHKSTSMPGYWRNRFRDSWERLLHFTIDGFPKINQEAVMVPAGEDVRYRVSESRDIPYTDTIRRRSASGAPFGVNRMNWRGREMVNPGNVLHGSPVTRNTGHSAAFPEWLPEWFIKLFTDPGDVVLDPFLGSGTTYRVAQRMGRVPVGIEINPDTNVNLDGQLCLTT